MSENITLARIKAEYKSEEFWELRKEALEHIIRLGSDQWTDYNLHDPGITILEVLCYAITDLAYRANLPMRDLMATAPGANEGKPEGWFGPAQILTCNPVTPLDFRKVIIDVKGVKNAWVFEACDSEVCLECDCEEPVIKSRKGRERSAKDRLKPCDEEGHCRTHLRGLYNILLDLDSQIDPDDAVEVGKIKDRVKARLHQVRNLCEDYYKIYVLPKKHIDLCTVLDVEPDADVELIIAELMLKIQDYWTPGLRFHTLAEMLSKGLQMDEIYDGPLLLHGFIDEAELAKAQLVSTLYVSDLYPIIRAIPKVNAIRDVRLRLCPDPGEAPPQYDKWCLSLIPSDFKDKSNPCLVLPENLPLTELLKPILDLDCSCITVLKNGITQVWSLETVREKMILLRRRGEGYCMNDLATLPNGGIPDPVYRPDLGDYFSIQQEFPETYHVGLEGIEGTATEERVAQMRQLKAFLLFFDQILANYLSKIAHLRDLLSIKGGGFNPDEFIDPTGVFNVPYVQDLLASYNPWQEDTVLLLTQGNWEAMKADLPGDLLAKLKQLIDRPVIGVAKLVEFIGEDAFEKYKDVFDNHFDPLDEEEKWEWFKKDPKNAYREALKQNALPLDRWLRLRGRLLDHLIARFGETFTDYALLVWYDDPSTPDPRDIAIRMETCLEDKMRFLREIDVLGYERGKAFNYRKWRDAEHKPDVWDSNNVEGLKKRVSRLLGFPDYERKTISCPPEFKPEVIPAIGQGRTRIFRFVLTDSTEKIWFESAKNYTTEKAAWKDVDELLEVLTNPDQYEPMLSAAPLKPSHFLDSTGFAWEAEKQASDTRRILAVGKNGKTVARSEAYFKDQKLAKSPPKSALATGQEWLVNLYQLVFDNPCNIQGFHLLEHILLRPRDKQCCDNMDMFEVLDVEKCLHCDGCIDPYSFWVTAIVPNWMRRFKDEENRHFFEQTLRRETPAHVALRICWVSSIQMFRFERAYGKWLHELAKPNADNCTLDHLAQEIVKIMNKFHDCRCGKQKGEKPSVSCEECNSKVVKTYNTYKLLRVPHLML